MMIERYRHLLDGKTGASLHKLPEGNVLVLQGNVPQFTGSRRTSLISLLSPRSGIVRVVFSKTALLGEGFLHRYRPEFYKCPELEEFVVDPENPEFHTADGMLFRQNELLCCAPAKEGVCAVPEDVKEIGLAFRNCKKLTQIHLPEGIGKLDSWGFGYGTSEYCPAMIYAPGVPWSEVPQIMKHALILGWAYAAADGLNPPEERLAEYRKFLKANRKKLYPLALQHRPLLQRLFDEKRIPYKEIEPLLEQAGDDTALKAALLDYMNRNFDVDAERRKIEKREEKVFDHVMETGQLPPAELNKLWSIKQGRKGQVGIAKYNGDVPARLQVPEVLRKAKVTAIEDWAFSNCKTLTEIILPKGLKTIGMGAFASCTALTCINFPKGFREIGDSAFARCASLTEITLPDSVKELDWRVFQGCTSLTAAVLPKKLEEIPSGLFEGCTALTGVTIPESVTRIGREAFKGCTSLTAIVIPESVTDIGGAAFKDCTGLTAIVIPDSVTGIGTGAFEGCANLREVVLPVGLMPQVGSAFWGTPWLKAMGDYVVSGGVLCACPGEGSEAVIPEGVTSLSQFAFVNREDISKVILPASLTELSGGPLQYGFSFNQKSAIAEVVLREGLQEIGSCAFANLRKLTEIVLPESVRVIDAKAFENCTALKSVCLPESLSAIGADAFEGCAALEQIEIPEGVKKLGGGVFRNCAALTWVSIPASLKKLPKTLFKNSPYVTLHAPAGSCAETFAKENGIPFEAL